MDTKKWRALLTAVKVGSFNKAAEKLGHTQSGMTYMMKSLEEEVGFPLLIRSWDGVRLTESGEKLLPAIRALCDCDDELQRQIDEIGGKHAQFIRICTFASVSVQWLSDILAEFRQDHPNIEIELRIGRWWEQKLWLERGEVSFSIADRMEVPQTEWIPLYDDPLVAVLPPDHPAASRDVFTLEDLGNTPALTSPYNDAYAATLGEFAATKNTLRLETEDDAVLLTMAAKGIGICFLPELAVRNRSDGVILRPLSPPVCRRLGIQLRRELQTPASQEMIDLICARLKRL